MLLSICIPNYNRGKYLNNCLNSILIAKSFSSLKFEICISDNGSKEDILSIIKQYKKKGLKINFKRNYKNLGFGVNFSRVIKMAKGEFIWLIGNDDLLYVYALRELENLFKKNKYVDFYFINSSSLNSKFVFKHRQPFNTKKIPRNLSSFSKIKKSRSSNFFDLVNPLVSWDFMLAMFLTISRRKKFIKNLNKLDKKKLTDPGVWSTIDNTVPHVKIFSHTFKDSNCYIQAKPLSVNLYGEKGWSHIYPFIMIIRIPEIIDIYRQNGLPFFKYISYKNYVLRKFVPYMYYIVKNKTYSNYKFISFKKNILNNIFYPNIYLFGIYYGIKKIFNQFTKVFR